MTRRILNMAKDEFPAPAPPPAPAPLPEQPELPLEGLRRGDNRIAVSRLQQRIGVAVTGEFDEMTEYTISRLQEQFGLDVNGVATPRVHGLLGLPWPPLDS
jgi:hypothetical protein